MYGCWTTRSKVKPGRPVKERTLRARPLPERCALTCYCAIARCSLKLSATWEWRVFQWMTHGTQVFACGRRSLISRIPPSICLNFGGGLCSVSSRPFRFFFRHYEVLWLSPTQSIIAMVHQWHPSCPLKFYTILSKSNVCVLARSVRLPGWYRADAYDPFLSFLLFFWPFRNSRFRDSISLKIYNL